MGLGTVRDMNVNGYEIGPGADLRGANLVGVNLSSANLEFANLTSANLTNADLEGATMPDGWQDIVAAY